MLFLTFSDMHVSVSRGGTICFRCTHDIKDMYEYQDRPGEYLNTTSCRHSLMLTLTPDFLKLKQNSSQQSALNFLRHI